jgi:hypothetical protein
MRLLLLTLLFVLCAFAVSVGQNNPGGLIPLCKNQADVELIGYETTKGSVEQIEVETETLIPQGDVIFTNKGRPILFATYRYDSEGRLREKNFYRIDGVALPKSTFEYDKDGILLRELDYSAVSLKPYLETDYVYDNGVLKEITGKNIEDGKVLSKKTFTYDRSRNYFEFSETFSYRSPSNRVGFLQDKNCQILEIIVYEPDGSVQAKATRSFDSDNNPTFFESKTVKGETLEKRKSEYEFDSGGNWIKRSDYFWEPSKTDGVGDWKLAEIIYRKIKYFRKN